MRLLVCGGRDFTDRAFVFRCLDAAHAKRPITTLIHGAARGADTLADEWAEAQEIDTIQCPANWELHGKAAGPIRNAEMLTRWKPDGVLAFPGGSGTAHMVKIAREAGLPVWQPKPRENAP